MSTEIPFNRFSNQFEPQGTHVSISHAIDDAQLNEVIGRLNNSLKMNTQGNVLLWTFILLCLAAFIAGWVLFGIGMGTSGSAILIAGIVVLVASVGVCIIVGWVCQASISNRLKVAVAAENMRYAGHSPPVTFRLVEETVHAHHYNHNRNSYIERKLIIEAGQGGAAANQPMKTTPEYQTNGPASTTVAANQEHSIQMPDQSMTRE